MLSMMRRLLRLIDQLHLGNIVGMKETLAGLG
jgi:hypothetical protein